MSALDELQAGAPGDQFLALLQRTIRAVAIARGFPPPEGHLSWGGPALQTAVAEFLASPQTSRRLIDLTRCRTELALRRRLETTVRNFLADQGRRTPIGRLVIRINDVLRGDPQFERNGVYWTLSAGPFEPAQVDLDALVGAVRWLDIVVPTSWAGERQSPDLDSNSVVRAATAMLQSAGGALRASAMAQALARRLGIGGAPLSIDAAAFDEAGERYTATVDSTSVTVLNDTRARQVFERLNDAERLSIGLANLSVEALGSLLGVSGSKASLIRRRAIALLQHEVVDDPDGQLIAEAVLAIARRWSESWMI
ncbi:MAG TPA: hypothetical protein VGB14_06030 [Acidimicrobiales bacterium]|jgi:hypothetical protein